MAFDATAGLSSAGAGPFSWAHTCTGSDLVLVVSVSYFDASDVITAVTYNSVAMTQCGSATNGSYNVYQYYLVNPATGSNNVSVSFSGTISDFGGTSISWTSIDQVTPVGTTATATGTDTTPTVNVSSAASETVIDALVIVHGGTLSVGAGQTQRQNAIGGNGFLKYASSSEGGAGTTTMSWSNSSSQAWAIVATPFKPASGATGQPLVKRLSGTPHVSLSTLSGVW